MTRLDSHTHGAGSQRQPDAEGEGSASGADSLEPAVLAPSIQ